MDSIQSFFNSNSSFTPSSPQKTRPLPSPSLVSLEEFNLNDIFPEELNSRKSSGQRFDKPILVIEYLVEKLKLYE
ncbi:unnamed protein product [Paramecium pentaurelia]|uniref:Uncharacterized protein n=1 Tax=Paramecium pentaurelia TaxID=43138 RepID=A0A8S1TGK1_9CILI|nr:unnamed protein product [Paramecium pentaurelia]